VLGLVLLLLRVSNWKSPCMNVRTTPYSVAVRVSTVSAIREREARNLDSDYQRPDSPLHAGYRRCRRERRVDTHTPPSLMQVSGARNVEETAHTGSKPSLLDRFGLDGKISCPAPHHGDKTAAEPKTRLLTIFMLTLQSLLYWRGRSNRLCNCTSEKRISAPNHSRSARQFELS